MGNATKKGDSNNKNRHQITTIAFLIFHEIIITYFSFYTNMEPLLLLFFVTTFALILILVMIAHAMISYFNIWFFLRISEESINDKIRCDHHERCGT